MEAAVLQQGHDFRFLCVVSLHTIAFPVFSPMEPPHAPVQLRLNLVQRMQRRVSRGVGGAEGMLRC